MKAFAVECLYKIASVLAAVLLYSVIAILQSPSARAANTTDIGHSAAYIALICDLAAGSVQR